MPFHRTSSRQGRLHARASTAWRPTSPFSQGKQLRVGQQLALERAVLLAKLLVNLHVYVEGSCSPELKVGLGTARLQAVTTVHPRAGPPTPRLQA